jgi:hypothetical protein
VLPPMPIVVGSARSGTTLLRLMLDSHPLLAIPPETHFIPALAALDSRDADELREAFWRTITNFPPNAPGWGDFGLCAPAFKAELATITPFTVSDGLRCFYRSYAKRQGKQRYGDKTPTYSHCLPLIAALLPEAAIVHIIRDGRDAALSLREMWFSPGSDIAIQAKYWRENVLAARAGAASCPRYIEVRYEDLVTGTEPGLRRICGFLDLPFDRAMMSYFERAARRLDEHGERVRRDGTIVVSRDGRRRQQWRTTTPPDPARIGQWRTRMPVNELKQFDSIAGDLLDALGYPRIQ